MIKIGLCGKVRSGKDTLAKYAEEKYKMMLFSFGEDLKANFHSEYPQVPKNPKPVRGYQLYGQLMRFVHTDSYWVDKCFNKINYVQHVAENYNVTGSEIEFMPIITDVRQQNEVDRCKQEGFIIIRINCPEEIRLERMKTLGDKFDKSNLVFETETAIDSFDVDYEINNEGSLNDLYKQFDEIVTKYME